MSCRSHPITPDRTDTDLAIDRTLAWLRWLLLAVAAVHCRAARADEIGLFGLLGMYNSNNPERVSSGARHDDVGYATLSSYGAWQTGRFTSHWDVQESEITYLHSRFGSKNYGTADIRSQYDSLSGMVTWRVMEDFGQLVENPAEADTPLNRSNFNVFSTGPTVRLPFDERTWAESSLLYSHTYYEVGTLGGDAQDAEIGINRSLRPKTSLGVFIGRSSGSTEEFGRYNSQRASLRLLATGAWTTVVANAGVDRAEQPVKSGNLLYYDLTASRALPSASKLELAASRKLTTASQEFGQFAANTAVQAAGNGAVPVSAVDLNTSTNLFNAETVRAAYRTKPRRTEWEFGLSWRKEDPLAGMPGDHRRYATVDASYYRVWGSKTGIRVYGAYGITRGEVTESQYNHQSVVGCEFAKPINDNPGMRWVATFERDTRVSNDQGAQYTEIRIGFYLRYSRFIYQRQ